jgi:hypothetical protein
MAHAVALVARSRVREMAFPCVKVPAMELPSGERTPSKET